MSIPLYMDHHVPAAITHALRGRGMDVITAFEDGTARWDDEQILERATQLGRVVYTQDDDFLAIADEWQQSGREFAGIVYATQPGITIAQAIGDLELIATVLEPDDIWNRIEFIPY